MPIVRVLSPAELEGFIFVLCEHVMGLGDWSVRAVYIFLSALSPSEVRHAHRLSCSKAVGQLLVLVPNTIFFVFLNGLHRPATGAPKVSPIRI